MNMNDNKQLPYIIFLTGASGAGKTTLLDALNRELLDPAIECLHFDSIGVPNEEEMVNQYGSGSEWQKAMTYLWVSKLTSDYHDKQLVILEGQVNLSFIVSAFEEIHFTRYKIVLVHCDSSNRHKRLHEDRNQPELVNQNMDNWSNFLKKQARDMNVPILDTSSMNIDEMLDWFKQYLYDILK